MAQSLITRPKPYLETEVRTLEESITFSKKIIFITFSHICKNRLGLSGRNFDEKNVGRLVVPLLDHKKIRDGEQAAKFLKWLKAIISAIDNGFFEAAMLR
jgi:hypothetical protein